MSKKETGLMFKAPLVRAILSDLKTQTRRAFSEYMMKQMRAAAAIGEVSHFLDDGSLQPNDLAYVQQFSPVGQPGDRIYVRETWAEIPRPLPLTDESLPMRKDDRIIVYKEDADWDGARSFLAADGCIRWAKPARWSPSIHMRKTDARIWLEITGVRVERLQSISEEDAKAEGAPLKNSPAAHLTSYRRGFQELWESTGSDWEANPWVWVIDFKRIGAT